MSRSFAWRALASLIVLVVAGIIAVDAGVKSYLRSKAFRNLVDARTGAALKGRAEYGPLRWSGNSAFSDSLEVAGLTGTPVGSLRAKQIRAEVNWRAIFSGVWRVDSVDVARADLDLTGGVLPPLPEEPAKPRKPSGMLDAIFPSRFELGTVRVQETNVKLSPAAVVQRCKLAVQREGTGWVFKGEGGAFVYGNRPPLKIESATVRFEPRSGTVFITQGVLRSGSGVLSASGEIGNSTKILVDWKDLDAKDLLDGEWQSRVGGLVAGNAEIRKEAGNSPLITGNFILSNGWIEGLPLQKQIAEFSRSPQFQRMPLHEVSGRYECDAGGVTIRNFVAESRGLFRMEGKCHVGKDRSLKGKFQIGVTPQTLQWLPGSQERVFMTSRNGYLWTDMEVGGTLDRPKENLSERLARAAGQELLNSGLQSIQQSPDGAGDAVNKAIELLSPLVQ